MKRYKVHLSSGNDRLFEVTVKADGMSDDGYLVKFWRKWGPFGLFRYTAHYVSLEFMVSAICLEANER